jgi:hypothetical protein
LLGAQGVFKARERRLRGQIETNKRIAVQQHLVNGIGGQPSRVVGVWITAGDREHALREKVFERMIDLGSLATVEQAVNHAGNQSKALFGSFQQHRSAIGTALPLIEFHHYRLGEDLWKQQTLCRGRIGQAKASSAAINTVLSTCL